MPTRTQPKRSRRSMAVRPPISKYDQKQMLACAGIDDAIEAAKATQFLLDVDAALAIGWATMLRIEDRPLPTHIAALLEPIARKSAELAELLHPLRLPVELRHMGTAINDTTYQVVSEVNAAAELMITQLRKQESRGAHRKISGDALKEALDYLGRVFDSSAVDDPSQDDRKEFLEICRRYIFLQARRAPGRRHLRSRWRQLSRPAAVGRMGSTRKLPTC